MGWLTDDRRMERGMEPTASRTEPGGRKKPA